MDWEVQLLSQKNWKKKKRFFTTNITFPYFIVPRYNTVGRDKSPRFGIRRYPSYAERCSPMTTAKRWPSVITRNVRSSYSKVIVNYYRKNVAGTADVYSLEPQLSKLEYSVVLCYLLLDVVNLSLALGQPGNTPREHSSSNTP